MLMNPPHTSRCVLSGLLTDLSHGYGELSQPSNPLPITHERAQSVVRLPDQHSSSAQHDTFDQATPSKEFLDGPPGCFSFQAEPEQMCG